MLNQVRIKNFKLHEDSTFSFAPITLFIGPNNTGKSSVYQVLQLLKQASVNPGFNTPFISPKENKKNFISLIVLGSFEDVVRNKQSPIEIRLNGGLTFKGEQTEIALSLWLKSGEIARHTGKLHSPSHAVDWDTDEPTRKKGDYTYPRLPRLKGKTLTFRWGTIPNFPLIREEGYGITGDASDLGQSVIDEILDEVREFFDLPNRFVRSIFAVYPLRGLEDSAYRIPEKKPDFVEGQHHEERSINLSAILAYDREFEERLSEWSEKLFGFTFKVSLREGYQLDIKIQRKPSRSSLLINEGSDANQLPYIILPLFFTPSGGSLILYEPEAHLHPRAQSELMKEILLKSHKAENKQLLIETHSEHILHSFLYAVRKGDLKPEDVAIYYFDNPDPKERKAKYKRLEITKEGQVKGGLPGFYDQALVELKQMLEPV